MKLPNVKRQMTYERGDWHIIFDYVGDKLQEITVSCYKGYSTQRVYFSDVSDFRKWVKEIEGCIAEEGL